MISNIKKVIYITLSWTVISLFNFFIGVSAVIDRNFIRNVDIESIDIDYAHALSVSIIIALIAGLLGGSMIVFVWEKWLRTKPYGWTLKNIVFSFSILFIFVSVPVILFNNTSGTSIYIWSLEAWGFVIEAFLSPSLLIPFFFWLSVVLLTFLFLQVNDKYGPGVFKKFLMGKYFHPSRERRIFMFLDLKSSTAIAEKLGEEKYFNFIKKVFEVVTPSILNNEGEIYQYVGDEIVISWTFEEGLQNNRCIRCFEEVVYSLSSKSSFFLKEFGILPEFKSGMHGGTVMAGELGIVKREIAYSGDVLNTAARIQSKCNELKVNILVSAVLIEKLDTRQHTFETIGSIDLRGKKERMTLFTVVMNS